MGEKRTADDEASQITSEMMEAGIREYVSADEVLETKEEIVSRIFAAMMRAKKAGSASAAATP
jgi:hypothetical protein